MKSYAGTGCSSLSPAKYIKTSEITSFIKLNKYL